MKRSYRKGLRERHPKFNILDYEKRLRERDSGETNVFLSRHSHPMFFRTCKRLMLRVFLKFSSFYVFKWGPSLNVKLTEPTRLATQHAPGSLSYLCVPSFWIPDAHHCTFFPCGCCELNSWFPCLYNKHFTD